MNKQSIKRILKYTDEESIPLAILGIIEGIIEDYQDGKCFTTFEVCEDISHTIEAWQELNNKKCRQALNEPCLSDE